MMNEKSVLKYISEKKVIRNFKLPKWNTRGSFNVDGEKNKFIIDYQFGNNGFLKLDYVESKNDKQKEQLRLGQFCLVRVDINSRPHMCVDGSMWKSHIHVLTGEDSFGNPQIKTYKIEDYNPDLFQSFKSWDILFDFFKLCNVDRDNNSTQEII